MDVIGIGSAFVDYFIKTDEAFLKKLGLKPEDDFLFKEKKISKNDIFDKLKVLTKSPGGISVNTIAALAKLNIKVGYCGVIGKDINGDFWTKNIGNIDLSRIKRVGKTSICACLLTSQGKKRTFLSEVNPTDFDFLKHQRWYKAHGKINPENLKTAYQFFSKHSLHCRRPPKVIQNI